MDELTVVYYSASTESPAFESRVQAQILEASGGLPIISVTQHPAPTFGRNICVGRVGCCDANAFRQLLIGAEQAKTEWIAVAEADALYPPEYFRRRADPDSPPCVRYVPVYILWKRPLGSGQGFCQKEWTEGAQYVKRAYLIHRLNLALAGRPEWSGPKDPHPREYMRRRRWGYHVQASAPVISCKTGRGLRWATGTIRGVPPMDRLPYWGRADDVRARFFEGS